MDDEEKKSTGGGSEILQVEEDLDDEEVKVVHNHQSRRSTITFLIKSHNDLVNEEDPSKFLMVNSEDNGGRSGSLDGSRWNSIKHGRRRASSLWSANSTALRVSISRALSVPHQSQPPITNHTGCVNNF